VDSLKFTSALSMCLSFLFISITLTLVTDRLLAGRIGPVNWLPDADASLGDVLKTLPVMMTAYVCHYNVHPIFAEMAAPSERRMRRVVSAALLLCSSVYWLVGLSAYLLFTSRTQDDVLMNYGRDLDMARGEAWVEHAVKAGYTLSLSCTFPLIQFALRQSVFDLAGWGDAREQPVRFYAVTVRPHSAALRHTHVRLHLTHLCAGGAAGDGVPASHARAQHQHRLQRARLHRCCPYRCAQLELDLRSAVNNGADGLSLISRLHPAGAGGGVRHAAQPALGLVPAGGGRCRGRILLLRHRVRPRGAAVSAAAATCASRS
jgi:hypothetical protein